ncbi:hypothetical protein U9M48_044756 [Paspalum notatum var. saurae]|uniref:Protein kinase domain-containing protein n=1 Tax=Paspalum notatum var. saurae TaxID=547442 RepID=A0AAQ3UVP7_PASNO
MDAGISGRRLTRLRTLGRGASGAVVALFAAGEGEAGDLLAVKSAPGGASAAAAQLRREGGIMAALRSPHVLPCLGFRAAAGGELQLLLEFAPGGSLADEAARNGGRLEEPAVRAYAADVARALAYLHGEGSVVHGDVKARNVVIGADGRAMLADFGCARRVGEGGGAVVGGTPAFMAPEVARGEGQGPAADVWALGCLVIEMATGRAPWAGVVDDVLAALRLIGYTDAVPEAPEWMSPEAKDFLGKCLRRDASERWTAAQLLEHPFLASVSVKAGDAKPKWVSPKSTLDAAFWESDADDEDDEMPPETESAADRIRALAGPRPAALPEWESDDGWIEVCGGGYYPEIPDAAAAGVQEVKFSVTQCEIIPLASAAAAAASSERVLHNEAPAVPPVAAETTSYENFWGDDDPVAEAELEAGPFGADLDVGDGPAHNVGDVGAYAHQQHRHLYAIFARDQIVHDACDEEITKSHSEVESPRI